MSQAETGKIALRPSSPLWPVVTRHVQADNGVRGNRLHPRCWPRKRPGAAWTNYPNANYLTADMAFTCRAMAALEPHLVRSKAVEWPFFLLPRPDECARACLSNRGTNWPRSWRIAAKA